MIGVTGATGYVGGAVARRLAARGIPQRLIVRDPARAPVLDGADLALASDYGAHDELRAALTGVETLFLVPGRESANRIEQHRTAIHAAAAAGVGRIVYVSFLNAAPDATFTLARHHWATEEHVRATGLAHTFLRMNLYLDFLPSMVGADAVIRGPAGDGAFTPVARDDVADVAAAVLTEPGHDGHMYDVTGGQRLTMAEVARALARLTGTSISYEAETLEEARASRAHYGAPDWEVEGWITSYAAIAAGELDVVADTVERIAGHLPTTLDEYVARTR